MAKLQLVLSGTLALTGVLCIIANPSVDGWLYGCFVLFVAVVGFSDAWRKC